MPCFQFTNHIIPPGVRGHTAEIDYNQNAFANIVARLAGAGQSVQATARAMQHSRELHDMPVGESRHFKRKGAFDLTIRRID